MEVKNGVIYLNYCTDKDIRIIKKFRDNRYKEGAYDHIVHNVMLLKSLMECTKDYDYRKPTEIMEAIDLIYNSNVKYKIKSASRVEKEKNCYGLTESTFTELDVVFIKNSVELMTYNELYEHDYLHNLILDTNRGYITLKTLLANLKMFADCLDKENDKMLCSDLFNAFSLIFNVMGYEEAVISFGDIDIKVIPWAKEDAI